MCVCKFDPLKSPDFVYENHENRNMWSSPLTWHDGLQARKTLGRVFVAVALDAHHQVILGGSRKTLHVVQMHSIHSEAEITTHCQRLGAASPQGTAQCFFNVLCCTEAAELQVDTTQIGRKTPTKAFYSSLHVAITEKQNLLGSPRLFSVLSEHSFQLISHSF